MKKEVHSNYQITVEDTTAGGHPFTMEYPGIERIRNVVDPKYLGAYRIALVQYEDTIELFALEHDKALGKLIAYVETHWEIPVTSVMLLLPSQIIPIH